MTDKEKIRAEIERRYAEYKTGYELTGSSYCDGAMDALDDLEQFIDSLPEEKKNPLFEKCLAEVDPEVKKEVNENVDEMLKAPNPEEAMKILDEKIAKASEDWKGVNANEYMEKVRCGADCDCKYVGCHINAERRWCHFLENEIPYDRCGVICRKYEKKCKESLTIPEICKENGDSFTYPGLEEAAENGATKYYADGGYGPFPNTEKAAFTAGFIAGVEWLKRKMMEEAVETCVDDLNGDIYNRCIERGLTGEDKVKLIILKDGES
jgi:hypothetical protein